MISVVMPAYNSSQFISVAIESILNQSYPELEFIIVDDGSTDNTIEIIEEYAAKDNRIRLITSDHGGPGNAMNVGIQEAKYKWVAVMHSDDVAAPNRLARQLEMAEVDPDVVIWGTDGKHIGADGRVISEFRVGPTSKEQCWKIRQDGGIVQSIHPTVMFRRDIALEVGGYDANLPVCEDIEFFDRMLTHGALVTIPEKLMFYRIHGSSLAMTKYLLQGRYTRFVKARSKRRMQTGEEISFDVFLKQYNRLPRLQRFNRYIKDISGMYYRRAGMAYSQKNYPQFICFFTLSLLLNPQYPISRAWRQFILPRLRNLL